MSHGRAPRRVASLALLTAIGAALWLAPLASWRIPDRWNPWAPLDPDKAPNLLTRFKLDRLRDDPAACRAALQRTSLRYAPVADRETREGCGWRDAVRVSGTPTRVAPPFVLACPAAVALALWQRHGVEPLALQYFNTPVVRIDDFGSYACRNIAGRADGRRSEHAYADAVDVAGFVLADGRSLRVAADWRGDDARSRFLHDVHDSACRYWNVVLGPDYNAAHHDHLHLDDGPLRACR